MRPLKLKLKGLNSFLEEQIIDFEKLTEKGLFGVFGPTGSGKTTILDGITLALYGEIPRKSTNYINTNVDTMEISYDFQIQTDIVNKYRVERSFHRTKNGNIRTKHARILRLYEGGLKTILEEGVRQVNNKCREILGLSIDDFTRTVVLPQGQFSEFLKLQGKERREMLERLFNLEKYGEMLTLKLSKEIKSHEEVDRELTGQLKSYEDINTQLLNEKIKEKESLEKSLEGLRESLKILNNEYINAKELWQLQKEYIEYEERLKQLKKAEEEVKNHQIKLQKAHKASKIKPILDQYERYREDYYLQEQKFREIKSKLDELSEKRGEILARFNLAQQNKEENLPILEKEELQYEEALNIDKTLNGLRKERDNLIKILKSTEAELDHKVKEASKLKEEIERISNIVDISQRQVENLELPYDYREKLSKGINLKSSIDEKIESQLELQKEIEALSKTIGKLETEKKRLNDEIKKRDEDLSILDFKLQTLRSNCPGDEELVLNKSNELNKVKQDWKIYIDNKEKLEKIEDNLSVYSKKKRQILKIKEDLEEKLNNIKNKYEKLNRDYSAYMLREQLKSGTPCPVCGSTEHKEIDTNHVNLEEKNSLADKIKELEENLSSLNRELAQVDGLKNAEEEKKREIEGILKSLSFSYEEVDVKKLESEFQNLRINIKKYNEDKNKLEEELQTFKEEKNKFIVELSSVSSSLDRYVEQLNTLKNKSYDKSIEITRLKTILDDLKKELEVTDIKKVYDEARQKEINSSKLKEEIKKSRKILLEYEKNNENINNEILKLKNNLTRISVSLEEKEKSIEEKQNEIITKIGAVSDINKSYFNVLEKIKRIKFEYEELLNAKNSIEELFLKQTEELRIVQSKLISLQENISEIGEKLNKEIKSEGFASTEEVVKSLMSPEDIENIEKKISDYHKEFNKILGTIENLKQKIKGRKITEEQYISLEEQNQEKTKQVEDAEAKKHTLIAEIDSIERRLETKNKLLKEKEALGKKLGMLRDLGKLFEGKRFVEYVATTQLKYVSMEASRKLFEISRGNYGLEVDDEGKFLIRDFKNGGSRRDPSTLSGGETFLTSLALALSLSSQIQLKGSSPLELFFLDEGFGTLDDETLEVVMDSLERIHHDRLSIGIISHVESIKSRVPIKLLVTPAQGGVGGSKVKIEYS